MIEMRIRFARRVLWRARSWVAVPAVFLAALGYWRDEGPANYQPPLASSVVGILPWWGWTILAMLGALLIILESSYRLVSQADPSLLTTPSPRPMIPDEELGLLDYTPEGKRALEDFTRNLQRLVKVMNSGNKRIGHLSDRLQRLDNVQAKQKTSSRIAAILDETSKEFEDTLPPLDAQSKRFARCELGLVREADFKTADDLNLLKAFRQSIVSFESSAAGARASTTKWRQGVIGLRGKNLSAAINRATDRLDKILANYLDVYQEIHRQSRDLVRNVDVRLAEHSDNKRKLRST